MQPQSPNPDYDFILKDAPAQKNSSLPKNPIVLLSAVIIVILFLVLVYGVVTSGKKGSGINEFTASIGQAQEINRVSLLEQPSLKDPNIAALATTAATATASEKAQLSSFLTSHKVKLDAKKLAAYKNSSTDTQMTTAAQTNSLDQAYAAYLKKALNDYASSLQNSYAATKNTTARAILTDAFNSTQAILDAPQLKTQ